MISKFEWTVAKRYLTSRGKDSFISVTAILSTVAIALGVMAIIAVMSVMNGFRAELIDRILGYNGHMLVQGWGGYLDDYPSVLEDLDGIAEIKRQVPFVESQAMLMHDGVASGGIVRGFPDRSFTEEGRLPIKEIKAGILSDAVSQEGLVIGYELARRLSLDVGDYATIISPKLQNTPFGSTFREQTYPIVAIVEIGVFQYDEAFVAMPIDEAQRFFAMADAITSVEIFVEDPEAVDELADRMQEIIGQRAHVTHWKRYNNALVGALEVERVAMFLVLSLIVIVAVFNIGSSLFMLVKDKSGDIAILRTMGSGRRSITKIFMIVGVTVGSIGTFVGTILGLLIVVYIEPIKSGAEWLLGTGNLWDPSVRFITSLRAEVNTFELILTVVVALTLSFLATIPPARRAAKLDPIEVLRHE